MPDSCTVKIFGRVWGLRTEDGARVSVPFGIYTMEELPSKRCRLSGEGRPTFELALSDVATYMEQQMQVMNGQWP